MPRVLLILAIIVVLVILVKRVQAMPPHKRRSGYLQLIFGGAAVGAILLVLAGKMHWIGAAATSLLVGLRQLLPVLIRAFPLLQGLKRQTGQSGGGQQSEVRSALLRMTLDHDTGDMAGEVIDGPFKDWLLSELSTVQLRQLLAYCESHDPDSAELLVSYLEQRFPGGFDDGTDDEQPATSPDTGAMTRSEALAVLGLGDEATADEITSAHKSLMQRFHPDRGGNDYLASKINAAKDTLLNS